MDSLPDQPVRRTLPHPSWCASTDCSVMGEHRGRWHAINPHSRVEPVGLDLRLTRAIAAGAPTWVELAATASGERSTFYLTVGQCRALRHILTRHLADIR